MRRSLSFWEKLFRCSASFRARSVFSLCIFSFCSRNFFKVSEVGVPRPEIGVFLFPGSNRPDVERSFLVVGFTPFPGVTTIRFPELRSPEEGLSFDASLVRIFNGPTVVILERELSESFLNRSSRVFVLPYFFNASSCCLFSF